MTTTPERDAYTLSAEGLVPLLLSVGRDIDGGYSANAVWAETCRMSAALIDAQAARIAELEDALEDERELARDAIRYG